MVAIDTLTVGTISPVIQSPRGYHIFTVTERIPEGFLPFDKMKPTIRRTFAADFSEKIRTEKVAVLKEKYGVTVEEGALSDSPLNRGVEDIQKAEEASNLFEMAQRTSDPLKRVAYYKEIVNDYPDDEHACEAQFMVGFVYSEELNNFELAREALQVVIDREEGCTDEIKSSAVWLLENMGQAPPEFETD